MKKTHPKRKLALNPETIRALQSKDLAAVAGGMINPTIKSQCPTECPNC